MEIVRRPPATGLCAALILAAVMAGVAHAQQIFRIVGPDGRVTFSDKPPAEPSGRATPVPGARAPAGSAGNALPLELRQVASRFPVTLYTAPNCAPCGAGRAWLSARGIPFAEKTVTSADDIEALRRLTGAPTLPFLTIGAQHLKGYSEIEWGQFLDAAGYPQRSQLPAGYIQARATPLVAVQEPSQAPAPPPAAAEAPAAAAEPLAAPQDNPAGIRF